MSEPNFDQALIAAAFRLAAEQGWSRVTIADAARAAGVSLAEARVRFPGKHTLLARFGQILDQAALSASSREGPARDQLFDLLMSRFDAMKPHREGIRALLRHLPRDPATALLLGCLTRRSMRWMLNAAGVATDGLRGRLGVRALVGVWLWTMRTFERDDTEDLSMTMAALDRALDRLHRAAACLTGRRATDREPEPDESAVPDGDAAAI